MFPCVGSIGRQVTCAHEQTHSAVEKSRLPRTTERKRFEKMNVVHPSSKVNQKIMRTAAARHWTMAGPIVLQGDHESSNTDLRRETTTMRTRRARDNTVCWDCRNGSFDWNMDDSAGVQSQFILCSPIGH